MVQVPLVRLQLVRQRLQLGVLHPDALVHVHGDLSRRWVGESIGSGLLMMGGCVPVDESSQHGMIDIPTHTTHLLELVDPVPDPGELHLLL